MSKVGSTGSRRDPGVISDQQDERFVIHYESFFLFVDRRWRSSWLRHPWVVAVESMSYCLESGASKMRSWALIHVGQGYDRPNHGPLSHGPAQLPFYFPPDRGWHGQSQAVLDSSKGVMSGTQSREFADDPTCCCRLFGVEKEARL